MRFFLKKFKLRFPYVSEDEILKFVHIYLIPDDGIIYRGGKKTYNDKATIFLNDVRVSRVSFAGIYLKTDKDTSYIWMNENSGLNLYFP